MRPRDSYVIYSPPYTEKYGGVMALHQLAASLRQSGASAYLWHADRPTLARQYPAWLLRQAKERARILLGTDDRSKLARSAPLASRRVVKQAVVVYPELIEGNPLNASRIVRWFLNRPVRSISETFGDGELCFYYEVAFNDSALNPCDDNQLRVFALLDDIYQRVNFGARSGTCYVLRKGRKRTGLPSTFDGEIIDDLPHRQIAALFNKREYCVSYDTYTAYSGYASLCGCKSVVIPEPGVSRHEWQPVESATYGIAYGFDDIPRAEATRPLMLERLPQLQWDNLKSVSFFRQRCNEFFKDR